MLDPYRSAIFWHIAKPIRVPGNRSLGRRLNSPKICWWYCGSDADAVVPNFEDALRIPPLGRDPYPGRAGNFQIARPDPLCSRIPPFTVLNFSPGPPFPILPFRLLGPQRPLTVRGKSVERPPFTVLACTSAFTPAGIVTSMLPFTVVKARGSLHAPLPMVASMPPFTV